VFEFCVQVVFEHFAPNGMKVFTLSVFCCQNLTEIEMRPQHRCTSSCALSWDLTQRRMVVSYWRFGTAWPLKRGPIGFPETSEGHNNSKKRQSPKERWSHSHGGGSLKSRISTIRLDGRTGKQTDRFHYERNRHKPADYNKQNYNLRIQYVVDKGIVVWF
jgi:hypothetical protein